MKTVSIKIDGRQFTANKGTVVAAAVLLSGETHFRTSVSGEPRGPLCGMGICFECRVTINGVSQEKSCQIAVTEGMEIITDGDI